jgi:hypothetical protein
MKQEETSMRTAVRHHPRDERLRILDRALFAAALLLTMLLISVQLARATEIIATSLAIRF